MGRYKRHHKKNNGNTIVTTRAINFQKAVATSRYDMVMRYPREFNKNRLPDISDRVKKILYSNDVTKPKPSKGILISKLIGDLLLSVKKRGKYGILLKTFNIDKTIWLGDNILPMRAEYVYYGRGAKFDVGNLFGYYGKFDHANLYTTLVGKLSLLNSLLWYNKRFYSKVRKEDILEYYAKDEIEKMGIKPLPNELVFACLFGTVFALIGLGIITLSLVSLFGIGACVIFLSFIGMVSYQSWKIL